MSNVYLVGESVPLLLDTHNSDFNKFVDGNCNSYAAFLLVRQISLNRFVLKYACCLGAQICVHQYNFYNLFILNYIIVFADIAL